MDCNNLLWNLINRIQAKADNAYTEYIALCRLDACLGWEIKVEKGIFGDAELKAHKDAAEKLGRHRALQEAVNLLDEARQILKAATESKND